MIITNSRYALVGYFITSYPTRAHGIIVIYFGGVFNKTIIPFVLVGYEIGYSELGPTGLVGYLPSHIQRALMK